MKRRFVWGLCVLFILLALIPLFLKKQENIIAPTPSPSPVSTSHAQSLDLDYGSFSVTVWPMLSEGWEMITKDTPDEWLGKYAEMKTLLDDRLLLYHFNVELADKKQGEYISGYFFDRSNDDVSLDFNSLSNKEIQHLLETEVPDDDFYKIMTDYYGKWGLIELQNSNSTWKKMAAIAYVDGVCIVFVYSCDTELYSVERAEEALSSAILRTSVKTK